MKLSSIIIILVLTLGLIATPLASSNEFSGYVEMEGQVFTRHQLYAGQDRDNMSVAVQPEYYHEWENGSSFTFIPFARVDSSDSERSHMDIRELNYLWLADKYELRFGIGKVFWGVTESYHLVDIVNQTDLVESINEEKKLGQPMIHLSIPRNFGVIDLFVLPYFRERTYPGKEGRFRSVAVVDTELDRYESAHNRHHTDFAIRYSHAVGDWDIGLSYFRGTNREPTLVAALNGSGEAIFIPYYEIIDQVGLDLQLTAGSWLWKLESIYRDGQGGDKFFASISGFEYTFTGVTGANLDIGLLAEWLYDERGENSTTGYDDDIFVGMRLAFNDAASTEVLFGLVQDIDSNGTIASVEASRRLGNNWKINLESYLILDASSNEGTLYAIRKDSHVRIRLAYYF